jgi:hypothetical protein
VDRNTFKTLLGCAAPILIVVLGSSGVAHAQTPATPPAPPGPSRPFEILDNSFLVEEAFNQEARIVQNIIGFMRVGRNWELMFTQEWPMAGQRSQFSYTVPVAGDGTASGIGDILLNYRYQLTTESGGRPAVSPRVSLVLPTSNFARSEGSSRPGIQLNLPVSKQMGDMYAHVNAGLTWLPRAAAPGQPNGVTLTSPFVAVSAIWRAAPMVHPLIEVVAGWEQAATPAGRAREREVIVSPGLRAGWNRGDRQIVLGLAAPISMVAGNRDVGGLVYLSYELPFGR